MQCYDPNKLIADVRELLQARGLAAEITDSRASQAGAATLLRSLGVMPAIDAADAYTQILGDGPWPDADDRRAARIAAS